MNLYCLNSHVEHIWPFLSKSWTLIANFDVIYFLHTNCVLKQRTANKYEYEIESRYSITLNFDERIEKVNRKIKQTSCKFNYKYNEADYYWLPRELIPISSPRSKIVGVYGLRWKFMQIQTQQVRIFRIFLLYTLAHPLYVKHIRPPSIKKQIITFFLPVSEKATVACLYHKAAKQIFKKSMETLFFLKKRKAATSS